MSNVKNLLDDQDPDYTIPISTNKNQEEVCEENARSTARKITAIIEKEFSQEIDAKRNEVLQIQERLHKALKTLHLLRYVIITDFYNRKQCQAPQIRETQQVRIHPAIKQLIGKSPKRPHNDFAIPSTSTDPRFLNGYSYISSTKTKTTEHNVLKTENITESSKECNTSMQFEDQNEDDIQPPKKIPRYIPPKSGVPEPACPSRGVRHKVRKRIVIGNISKWIPPDWREDPASHKWTIYVRGSKEVSNIGDFVSKVRFFLHPSYRPNDVVEVSSAPFHLSRRGWGEFPLRVQLHFKNPINKPMDIIHHLKLDRTYTGLQTLGSETIVDVWIYTMDPSVLIQANNEISDSSTEEINPCTVNDVKKSDSMIIGTSQKSSTSIDSATITVKSETNDIEVPNIDNKLNDMKMQLDVSVVKSEPNDEITGQSMSFMTNNNTLTSSCNSNMTQLEQIQFSVCHDHDYINNYISNETNLFVENNITIEHLPEINPIKKSINSMVELSGNNTNSIKECFNNWQCTSSANTEKSAEINTSVNKEHNIEKDISDENDKYTKVGSSSLWVKNNSKLLSSLESIDSKTDLMRKEEVCSEEVIQKEHFGNNINESNKSTSCPINFKSNLRPLQISIPPSFEPAAGKHMLILQNNKRTSMEANNICPSKMNIVKYAKNHCKIDTNNCLSYVNSKTSILIPRGTSLLKKQTKQTGKPTTNNKNDNTYAILEIKPSNSLLLNLNSDVPALKIADNASNNTTNSYNTNSSHLDISTLQKDQTLPKSINHNGKIGKSRIILGKDKLKLHSKEDLYDKVLKSIEIVKITDIEGLLRFIIRRIPIVTPYASDPDYKRLHPYACATEEEYFNHNMGKRAAYEWWRAKTIRSFLRKKLTAEDKLWSVKEIILWARLYGYTPTRSCFGIDATTTMNGAKRLPCTEISATTSTCTEPIAFQKWLQTSYDISKNLTTDNDDSQEEDIDILTCQNSENNKTTQQNCFKFDCNNEITTSRTISLDLEEKLLPLHNFICETTRSIGITLKPEEIVPNVFHCTASRVMIRAMECFIEDIVRTSLAKAWEKSNGKECPQTLSLDDVRSALTSREEFDIFTNEGLGSRYQLTTED
ncbi:uncharacterized protein LOC124421759 [Vespa crabro]|uniref:uncharacterized protein LOC124421759 n=1 Tax=Vespa crabro TaxID=7445 RepID=UPI001F027326|nr:uncharacterized protein LOC124421759 [Vespa crabro]XP_046813297.1 uncharacterized protein LOC124421759 [Vespa crabro]